MCVEVTCRRVLQASPPGGESPKKKKKKKRLKPEGAEGATQQQQEQPAATHGDPNVHSASCSLYHTGRVVRRVASLSELICATSDGATPVDVDSDAARDRRPQICHKMQKCCPFGAMQNFLRVLRVLYQFSGWVFAHTNLLTELTCWQCGPSVAQRSVASLTQQNFQ